MSLNEQEDGVPTTPYQAAGGIEGITKLVDEFYVNMDTLPEAKIIRAMHPPDLTESRKKLTYFLCGWLGGPRLFQQHYGPISIPGAHKRFPISYDERDAWHAVHAAGPCRPAIQYRTERLPLGRPQHPGGTSEASERRRNLTGC